MEAVGIAASCISIAELAAASIKHLHSLQHKLQTSDRNIQMVTSQLVAVKSATSHIQKWLDQQPTETFWTNELRSDLDGSLAACQILLGCMQAKVGELDAVPLTESWRRRFKYAWNECEVRECQDMLRDHIQALSLLLQVAKLPSSGRADMCYSDKSNEIFQNACENSPSSIWRRNSDSTISCPDAAPNEFSKKVTSFISDHDEFGSPMRRSVSLPNGRCQTFESRQHHSGVVPWTSLSDVDAAYVLFGIMSRNVPMETSSLCRIAAVFNTTLDALRLLVANAHREATRNSKSRDLRLMSWLSKLTTKFTFWRKSFYESAMIKLTSLGLPTINEDVFLALLSATTEEEKLDKILWKTRKLHDFTIYPNNFTVGCLLNRSKIAEDTSDVAKVFLPLETDKHESYYYEYLTQRLKALPVAEIRKRRSRLACFIAECNMTLLWQSNHRFMALVFMFARYHGVHDGKDQVASSRRDISKAISAGSVQRTQTCLRRHVRLQQVAEIIAKERIQGFFRMIYLTRRFRQHLEAKRQNMSSQFNSKNASIRLASSDALFPGENYPPVDWPNTISEHAVSRWP